MPDPDVARWKQQGRVFLWRYTENTRNYPGWQLAADAAGVDSLLALAAAMLAARYSSRQTVRLSPPTEDVLSVPNNRGGRARWRAPREWQVVYPKHRASPEAWSFPRAEPCATLTLGESGLRLLRQGLEDIRAGEGDYSIPDFPGVADEERLWFWWSRDVPGRSRRSSG